MIHPCPRVRAVMFQCACEEDEVVVVVVVVHSDTGVCQDGSDARGPYESIKAFEGDSGRAAKAHRQAMGSREIAVEAGKTTECAK